MSMSVTETSLMHLSATTTPATQRPLRMQILVPSMHHLAFLMGQDGSGAELNQIGKRAGCEIQLGGTMPDATGVTQGRNLVFLALYR
jgi:hypothetical protein